MQFYGKLEELQSKCMIEPPNMVEPFFNIEEGLKIGPLKVYFMLENRSLKSQTKHAKYWHKERY